MQMNRGGFLYVLDRATGELLSANAYTKVSWATHVDMKTGRPVESEVSKKLRAGEQIQLYPSIRGGKNWPHAAYNPNTGLLYANTNEGYSNYKFVPLAEFKPGFRFQGVENTYSPVTPDTTAGWIEAIDPMTAKPKWRVPVKGQMIGSAMLATGGGLLFTGKHTGEFIALDADNGEHAVAVQDALGHQRAAGHLDAQRPAVRDRAVGSGRRDFGARRGLPDVPLGGSVWTFALMPE